MKDTLDDVDEEIVPVSMRKSSSKQPRRTKSEGVISEKSEGGERRGRKKSKIEENKEQKVEDVDE